MSERQGPQGRGRELLGPLSRLDRELRPPAKVSEACLHDAHVMFANPSFTLAKRQDASSDGYCKAAMISSSPPAFVPTPSSSVVPLSRTRPLQGS